MIPFPNKERIAWIDWMKSIGIYFIVLGHFFSFWNQYVYVFNVPLFFVISGFLCKREEDNLLFWKKLYFNLVVPMCIICVVNYCLYTSYQIYQGSNEEYDILDFVFKGLIGMHSVVKECWFIYTLIIIKIINQYTYNIYSSIFLFVLFLCGAYFYNHIDFQNWPIQNAPNSIINVCTAYPFFIIGTYLRKYKKELNNLRNKTYIAFIFILSIVLVYVSGQLNDRVLMYICGYGNNIFLFLIGGIAGTAAIYAVSKLFHNCPHIILVISKGTILILGFHILLIHVYRKIIPTISIYDYVFAALIVIAFVPLIMFSEKFFPIIIGKYRFERK